MSTHKYAILKRGVLSISQYKRFGDSLYVWVSPLSNSSPKSWIGLRVKRCLQ